MSDLESLSDGHSIECDGDDYVIETPFGTARFEMADASETADEQLRGGQWTDLDLQDRWYVLFEEVHTTMRAAREEDII